MLSLSTATRNQNIDLYTQPPCKDPLKGIPATYQSRQVICSSQKKPNFDQISSQIDTLVTFQRAQIIKIKALRKFRPVPQRMCKLQTLRK